MNWIDENFHIQLVILFVIFLVCNILSALINTPRNEKNLIKRVKIILCSILSLIETIASGVACEHIIREKAPTQPSDVIKGDIIDDGVIDQKDYEKILSIATAHTSQNRDIRLTDSERYAADFNNDDTIDVEDAQSVYMYYTEHTYKYRYGTYIE